MLPPVQKILDITRQYKEALQQLSEAQDEHDRLLAVCKEMDIKPPPKAFVSVNQRIKQARALSDSLFFAIQDLGRSIGKQRDRDGAQ